MYNRSRKGIAPLSGFAAFIRGFLTLLDTDISIYNTDKIARWWTTDLGGTRRKESSIQVSFFDGGAGGAGRGPCNSFEKCIYHTVCRKQLWQIPHLRSGPLCFVALIFCLAFIVPPDSSHERLTKSSSWAIFRLLLSWLRFSPTCESAVQQPENLQT